MVRITLAINAAVVASSLALPRFARTKSTHILPLGLTSPGKSFTREQNNPSVNLNLGAGNYFYEYEFACQDV